MQQISLVVAMRRCVVFLPPISQPYPTTRKRVTNAVRPRLQLVASLSPAPRKGNIVVGLRIIDTLSLPPPWLLVARPVERLACVVANRKGLAEDSTLTVERRAPVAVAGIMAPLGTPTGVVGAGKDEIGEIETPAPSDAPGGDAGLSLDRGSA